MLKSHPRNSTYPSYKEKYKYVTKWCDEHFEPFNSDKIIQKMIENGTIQKEDSEKTKLQWKNTAIYGKSVHKQIEMFTKNETINNPHPEFLQFLKYHKTLEEKDYEIEVSEFKIYDEDLKLCGCVDMIYKHKKEKHYIIIDWKTSKNIKMEGYKNSCSECIKHIPDSNYWHYTLQLNYYKYILENKYNLKIKKMLMLVLCDDKYTEYIIPDCTQEISSLNNLLLHRD